MHRDLPGKSRTALARLSRVSPYLTVAGVVLTGVLLFVAGMGVRRLLAPYAQTEAKLTTYECGVDPVGEGWAQSNVRYFLYAFLYVIFAVDAIYLFPWATVIRSADLGMASLAEMAIFIGVLLVGLAHAARRGLLRWV
jgi:NADH-quinone oxidoreductase subunit A